MKRLAIDLNRDWHFRYEPALSIADELVGATAPADNWKAIALPHTWQTWETTGQVHPFMRDPSETDDTTWWFGWGYYRKRIEIDQSHMGKRFVLQFDGVMKRARVYVNGVELAEHRGGYTGFTVDITDALRWGEENVIAVAVSNRRESPLAIPPMTAGNFNVYGGIYRPVRLVLLAPVHITFPGEAPGGVELLDEELTLPDRYQTRARCWVRNHNTAPVDITLDWSVTDPHGNLVAEGSTAGVLTESNAFEWRLQLEAPVLWSPHSPGLYRLDVTLRGSGGVVLDRCSRCFGVRQVAWAYARRQLLLNGEPVPRLIGTNRHQEYPWLGDAIPRFITEMDLEDIWRMGHNFARFTHYPQDPYLLDWCDRKGLMLCEEVPCIKSLPFAAAEQKRQVEEMIHRDRHHPAIVMWSMGNETNNAADGAWALALDRSRIIHYRHVSGLPDVARKHTDAQIDFENLLKCTVRGWNDDTMDAGRQDPGAQCTGSEQLQYRIGTIPPKNGRNYIGEGGNLVTWIYADHGADREYLHAPLLHLNPKGRVDLYRQPKIAYYQWCANFGRDLMVKIQDWNWRAASLGEPVDVRVDSNAEQVELFVGEASLGLASPAPDNHYCVVWRGVTVTRDAPLHAVGHRGNESCADTAYVTGPPAALRLSSSHSAIPNGREGIALLTVSAVDADGHAVRNATPTFGWSVSGPGRLLAPSLWTTDIDKEMEREGLWYTALPVQVPLRSELEVGVITVTVHGQGLVSASVTLESVAAEPSCPPGIALPVARDLNPAPPPEIPVRTGETWPQVYMDQDLDDYCGDTREEQLRNAAKTWFGRGWQERHGAQGLFEGLRDLFTNGNGTAVADDINSLTDSWRRGR